MPRIHAIQMVSGSDIDTNLRQLEGQLRHLVPVSERSADEGPHLVLRDFTGVG